jgi:hypothetical protein
VLLSALLLLLASWLTLGIAAVIVGLGLLAHVARERGLGFKVRLLPLVGLHVYKLCALFTVDLNGAWLQAAWRRRPRRPTRAAERWCAGLPVTSLEPVPGGPLYFILALWGILRKKRGS